MEKKYQIFISSTFTDLRIERSKAMNAVLTAECIPSGMELFIAQDEEQFIVIKKIIDLCDFYLLILGGRYGSIEPNTGKSYTELEYEYAMSKNIPVLVFAYEDFNKCERDSDEISKGKFVEFRNKVLKDRLGKTFNSPDELFGIIIASIFNAKSTYEMPGWIRGGKNNEKEMLQKIYELQEENKELKEQISNQENSYKFLEKTIQLHYEETLYMISSSDLNRYRTKDIEPSYKDLFLHLASFLTSEVCLFDYEEAVNNFVPGFHTSKTNALKIKSEFLIHDLFKERNLIDKKGRNDLMVSLTEKGFELLSSLSN